MKKNFYNKRHRELYAKHFSLEDTLKKDGRNSRLSKEEEKEFDKLERKMDMLKQFRTDPSAGNSRKKIYTLIEKILGKDIPKKEQAELKILFKEYIDFRNTEVIKKMAITGEKLGTCLNNLRNAKRHGSK